MRSKDLAFIEQASSDVHPLDVTHGQQALLSQLDRLERMRNRQTRLSVEGLVSQHDIQDMGTQFGFQMSARYPLATYTQLPSPTNLRPTLEELSESLGQAGTRTGDALIGALQETLDLHAEILQEAAGIHERMFGVHAAFRERYKQLIDAGTLPTDNSDAYVAHYNEIYADLLGEEHMTKAVTAVSPILTGIYALITDALKGSLSPEELDQRFVLLQERLQTIVGGEMRSMRELAFALCSQINTASEPHAVAPMVSCAQACEILTKAPRASVCPIITASTETVAAALRACEEGSSGVQLMDANGQPSLSFRRLKDLNEALQFLFGAQWLFTKQCWNLYKDLAEYMAQR